MFGKILLFICVVGFTSAVFVDTSENPKDLVKGNPQAWQMVKVYHPPSSYSYKYEPYAYPKYEFEYSVSDKKTGDHKHHHEARDGDQVRGEYSLVESDGSLRKVQYHADDHNGFNAIVSKTVNKHGDDAVSVSDHTRFFYPVGHNVKINHYFPGKDYHYENMEKLENDKTKPVHEEKPVVNKENTKVMVIDPEDKLMVVEPVKFEETEKNIGPIEAPAPKTIVAEPIPVSVVPTIVPANLAGVELNKVNEEALVHEPVTEKLDSYPSNELRSKDEDQKAEHGDHSDSDVASSYYHSNIYFVAY